MDTTKTKKPHKTRDFTLSEALKEVNLCELSRVLGVSRRNVGNWRTKGQGMRENHIPMVAKYLKMEFIGYNTKKEPLFKRLA